MRIRSALGSIVCLVCALAPSIVAAQQAESLLPRNLTPIAIDEPRNFPPRQPNYASPPQPLVHRIQQPPVNFRQISAEEAVKPLPAKPPLRLAPRSESGRQSIARPEATSPANAIGTVVASLGAVLGVFLVIVWCSRRFTPAGAALLPKEAVELLGRAPLAPRQQMQLVRVGNKLLLVAISSTGVETLTEISDPAEVEHLASLCKRGQAGSATAAFRQALTQLDAEPAPRGFVGAARTASRGAP